MILTTGENPRIRKYPACSWLQLSILPTLVVSYMSQHKPGLRFANLSKSKQKYFKVCHSLNMSSYPPPKSSWEQEDSLIIQRSLGPAYHICPYESWRSLRSITEHHLVAPSPTEIHLASARTFSVLALT